MAGSFGVVTVGEEVGASVEAVVIRLVGVFPRVGVAFLDDGDGRFPVVEPSEEVWFSGTATDWLGFSLWSEEGEALWSEEDAVPVSQLLSGEEEGVFPQAVDRKQRAPLKTMQRIRTANLARWYMLDKSFPIFCFVYSYLHYKNKRALTEWNIYYENVRNFSFLYDALFVFVFDLWEPLRYNTYCQDLKKQRGE